MRTRNPALLGFNVSYFSDLGRFVITKQYIFWAVWVILCSSDFSKSPYHPLNLTWRKLQIHSTLFKIVQKCVKSPQTRKKLLKSARHAASMCEQCVNTVRAV